jgi:putative inorganic carbon (hco3(-)) transporter
MRFFKFIQGFDRLHWLWLALCAPFLLFISPTRLPALLVVPGLWLLHWFIVIWERKRKDKDISIRERGSRSGSSSFPLTPLNVSLLLMSIMVFVSLWVTFDASFSLPKISGVVLGLGIFYAVVRECRSPRGWWLCLMLFLAIGLGISLLGLLGTSWITKISFLTPITSILTPRIVGLPGAEEGFHPNYVAGALLWAIPGYFTLSWMLVAKGKAVRIHLGRGKRTVLSLVVMGATLWMLAVFLLTQSRGGYISLALTLPLLALLLLPPKWRWYSLILLVVLGVLAGTLVASRWEAVSSWVAGGNQTADPAFSLSTLEGRMQVWARAIYGIQDFPLSGMGMNAFRKVLPVLYPLFRASPNFDIGHAHNEFLQAAVDLGIPGLVAFISLYVIGFWALFHVGGNARVQSDPGEELAPERHIKPGGWFSFLTLSPVEDPDLTRMAVVGLGGGLLAHLLWGMTDAMALGARPAFLFWLLLGLICGLYRLAEESRR